MCAYPQPPPLIISEMLHIFAMLTNQLFYLESLKKRRVRLTVDDGRSDAYIHYTLTLEPSTRMIY